MMTDIVERLRSDYAHNIDAQTIEIDPEDLRVAADEIERLRRAVDKMADAAGPAYTPRWVLELVDRR